MSGTGPRETRRKDAGRPAVVWPMRHDETMGRSRAVTALRAPAIPLPVPPPGKPAPVGAIVARPRRSWPLTAAVGLIATIATALLFRDPAVTGDAVFHLIW